MRHSRLCWTFVGVFGVLSGWLGKCLGSSAESGSPPPKLFTVVRAKPVSVRRLLMGSSLLNDGGTTSSTRSSMLLILSLFAEMSSWCLGEMYHAAKMSSFETMVSEASSFTVEDVIIGRLCILGYRWHRWKGILVCGHLVLSV